MNKKSIAVVCLLLLLALISVLGLPLMTRSMERRAESLVRMVTAAPTSPEATKAP